MPCILLKNIFFSCSLHNVIEIAKKLCNDFSHSKSYTDKFVTDCIYGSWLMSRGCHWQHTVLAGEAAMPHRSYSRAARRCQEEKLPTSFAWFQSRRRHTEARKLLGAILDCIQEDRYNTRVARRSIWVLRRRPHTLLASAAALAATGLTPSLPSVHPADPCKLGPTFADRLFLMRDYLNAPRSSIITELRRVPKK